MSTKLQQCQSCGGFVPRDANACPHCSTTRSLAKRLRLGALGGALGGGAIAFTLMACYGAAPCPDGQKDCYKSNPTPSATPSSTTATPPSAPDAGK